VPGRYTTLWFRPTVTGAYHLFCAEYCGTQHSLMGARIVVMPPSEFSRWLARGTASAGLAQRGFDLYRQYGCSGCHEPGSAVRSPPLENLLGRPVPLADGRTVVADESYLRDSIVMADRDVVAGFAAAMPSFRGQISEEDIQAIVEYLRSKGAP